MVRVLLLLALFFGFKITYAQYEWRLSGKVFTEQVAYDPEVPFRPQSIKPELYCKLIVNGDIIHEWESIKNVNNRFLETIEFRAFKEDTIVLEVWDEDQNPDDLIATFSIDLNTVDTEPLTLSSGKNEIILDVLEIFDARMEFISFTPTKKYRGKLKRGMKKEGLSWTTKAKERYFRSKSVKGASFEKIEWKESCVLSEMYYGKEFYFSVSVRGGYYVDVLVFNHELPYRFKLGVHEIENEYGIFLMKLTRV